MEIPNRRRFLQRAVAISGLVGSIETTAATTSPGSRPLDTQVKQIRGLTRRYDGTRGIRRAFEDGYLPAGPGPEPNWALVRPPVDAETALRDPIGLMYVKLDGSLRLGGVGYAVPYSVDPPDLFNDEGHSLRVTEADGWNGTPETAYAVFSDGDSTSDESITARPLAEIFDRDNWHWVPDQPGDTLDVDGDGTAELVDYVYEKPPVRALHVWVHEENPCGLFALWYDRCDRKRKRRR